MDPKPATVRQGAPYDVVLEAMNSIGMRTIIATLAAGWLVMAPAQAEGDYIADMEVGRTAFRAGDFATAEPAFQDALKAADTDKRKAMALFALALTALRLGHMEDAKARAEQSLVAGSGQSASAGSIADRQRRRPLSELSSGHQNVAAPKPTTRLSALTSVRSSIFA